MVTTRRQRLPLVQPIINAASQFLRVVSFPLNITEIWDGKASFVEFINSLFLNAFSCCDVVKSAGFRDEHGAVQGPINQVCDKPKRLLMIFIGVPRGQLNCRYDHSRNSNVINFTVTRKLV